MIIVRLVLRVRPGKIRQVVEATKRSTADAPNRPRILTDLSGPMNTMVLEMRHESLAAAEQARAAMFESHAFQEDEDARNAWVETGAAEWYTIEQE